MQVLHGIILERAHLSSVFGTCGLQMISTFNESFASALYQEQYDALCFARDAKIVGASYIVSLMFDIIIGLAHGLFKPEGVEQKIYEARTKKILLISNSIATTSTIINATITNNSKNLDVGSLISTVGHLFTDIRFIAKLKHEFITREIDKKLQEELNEIDNMYNMMQT